MFCVICNFSNTTHQTDEPRMGGESHNMFFVKYFIVKQAEHLPDVPKFNQILQ